MAAGCSSCGRQGGRGPFCEGCGAALPRICPACEAIVSADARYCASCGARLDVGDSGDAEGERRQLAVLFCDVVESTPLAQRMDVEEFAQLMFDLQQLAGAAITALGGTVGTYAGDGLVAWFGWPLAHEEDTARATHAGLEILVKLDALNATVARPHGVRVAMRVAVHVGPVVLRTERLDAAAFGETFHVAARLESVAE